MTWKDTETILFELIYNSKKRAILGLLNNNNNEPDYSTDPDTKIQSTFKDVNFVNEDENIFRPYNLTENL